MARFLLALLFIAVTVYAVADWVVRSRTYTPGRVNRWIWLAVILLIPMVGPLTWIIVGMVTRAEEQRRSGGAPRPDPRDFRPDDNPDAVSDIVDRINRRQRRTKFGPGGLDLSHGSKKKNSKDPRDDTGFDPGSSKRLSKKKGPKTPEDEPHSSNDQGGDNDADNGDSADDSDESKRPGK